MYMLHDENYIFRDSVTVYVNAIMYYRVVDAVKARNVARERQTYFIEFLGKLLVY